MVSRWFNACVRRPLARSLFVATLFIPALFVVAPAFPHVTDGEDILVISAQGDARLTQKGIEQRMKAGLLVLVPAVVRTGHDGTAELEQEKTRLRIGADTVLELPAPQVRGGQMERIVQKSGSAFYDVGKREGSRRLRVETPYLVAVIKGTQFSVAVQDDTTSISLFEGSLQIETPDGGAVVSLEAGEIAVRRRGEDTITVVRGEGPRAGVGVGAARTNLAAAAETGGRGAGIGAVAAGEPAAVAGTIGAVAQAGAPLALAVGANSQVGLELTGGAALSGAGTGVNILAAANTGIALEIGPSDAGAEVAASVVAGPAAVDIGAAGGLDVGDAGIGVGAAVDVGLASGLLTTDAGATVSVDLGTDSGVGAVVNAGVAAGITDSVGIGADLGLSVGVDPAAGGIDVAANVGTSVDAGPVSVDVGAGVDAGAGSVDVSVGVGDIGVNLGVDLALGGGQPGALIDVGVAPGTEGTNPIEEVIDVADDVVGGVNGVVEDAVEDVGGLLNGLFRRTRRP